MKAIKIILLLGTALHGFAGIYRQAPDGEGGYDSDSFVAVADQFRVSQNAEIGSVRWWGFYYNARVVPDDFVVRIFADLGGKPGATLLDFRPGASPAIPAPDVSGFRTVYSYEVNLPATFHAQAGAQYWLSVVNLPTSLWDWQVSRNGIEEGGIVMRSFNGGGVWQPYLDNMSFELIAVPEPSPLALLAAVSAGGIMLRRRRQFS